MSGSELLKNKIEILEAKICVIGLGQVGLPTALSFSKIGFDVFGHDIDENLLNTLKSKKLPFEEEGLEEILRECSDKKKFIPESDFDKAIDNSQIIIVCVATPLTENVLPDLSSLKSVCTSLSQKNLDEKLIIIESSIPPGTFENTVLPVISNKNSLRNFWAAYVPERLSPGQAFSDIRSTPRVIGYADPESGLIAQKLYQKIGDSEIFVTPVKVAEVSKLVENTFRDVNIAFANEVGLICEQYGIDVSELRKVCNSHPRVNLLQPGPGVGGPCLPKDPYLLINPQNQNPITSVIIPKSRRINDQMPIHVVKLLERALKKYRKTLDNCTITILGVAYKGNVSDTRLSPAKEIISLLLKKGSKVLVFDPKTSESFGGLVVQDYWKAISQSDGIIVVTDHAEFKKMDLAQIKNTIKTPILIDTRRIFSNKEAEKLGLDYVSIGYSKNLS